MKVREAQMLRVVVEPTRAWHPDVLPGSLLAVAGLLSGARGDRFRDQYLVRVKVK